VRLAFPGGKPRPKPGPYRPEDGEAPTRRKRNLFERRKDGAGGPEQSSDGVRVSMPQS
jgi:NADPH-dependent stearoyl-CoA 9-desaturase